MPSLMERLFGKKTVEKAEEAPQKVSEEAARLRREALEAEKKAAEAARLAAEQSEKARLSAIKAAEEARVKVQEELARATGHIAAAATAATPRTYVVKSGDSLSKIAKELLGDAKRWPEIYEANKALIGDNPNLIHPGQTLVIK